MEWYEVAFDRLYPLIYGHRDLDEASEVVEAIHELLSGREPILDLACGGGRYLESLSKKGHRAFGLDLSLYLLSACADRWGRGGEIVQGDMRHLPFLDGSFGSVINMFTSFGYFSLDTDNLLVFKEVYRVLTPGGVFLFDFLNAQKISSSFLEETLRERGHYRIKEKRKLVGPGKYIVKDIGVTNLQDGSKMQLVEKLRLYTKDELTCMFESAGFEAERVFGDYSLNEFLDGVSERVIILARKT